MKDTQEIVTELTGAGDVEAWRVVLEDLAEERGYFDALGVIGASRLVEPGSDVARADMVS
jgi:hypothetical protein